MLEAIGPVAYQTLDKQAESRYANIRGYGMIDPGLELPSNVAIRTPWNNTYLQSVVFTRIPDHCFICLFKGHWPRSCPDKQKNEDRRVARRGVGTHGMPTGAQPNLSPLAPPDPPDGFIPVVSRAGTRKSGGIQPVGSPRRRNLLKDIELAVEKTPINTVLSSLSPEAEKEICIEDQEDTDMDHLDESNSRDEKQGQGLALGWEGEGEEEEEDQKGTKKDLSESSSLRQVLGRASKMKDRSSELGDEGNGDVGSSSRLKGKMGATPIPPPLGIRQKSGKQKSLSALEANRDWLSDGQIRIAGGSNMSSLDQRSVTIVWGRFGLAAIRDLMGEEKWCVMGDFNNIEIPEEAKGRSALIKGSEECIWRQMAIDLGLVDTFFWAAKIEGPRVYLTQGATWIDHVSESSHLSGCVISDHMLVTVDIQAWQSDNDVKPASYFKMDFFDLNDLETMQRVKEAWVDEQVSVRDDHRRWARGWHRVRAVLQEVRRVRLQQKREECTLRQEVVWRRTNLVDEHLSHEDRLSLQVALSVAERKLKEQELYDARIWRIRSREKWLQEDEVPSRYFFAEPKSKWARESLAALSLPDGEATTDRQEILEEILRFYQELYTAEPVSSQQAELGKRCFH
ncbi:hypothetical protein R1sor_020829 [Riccia sorocarpa]|uniref:DUF4283 domain-containing protein n=1 Tax=Riccia sorocarpa TaxID=122646 RepID=A0ABD3GG16_9MARC